ncbi:hypothetical protein HKD37_09G025344 [Glycine soja]
MKPKWRRTKAQVEKDKAPEWRRMKAQVEKDESPEAETLSRLLISFSLGSLLNQFQTYQGNPCGVYPDLSSFTGSGVIQISVACIKRSAPRAGDNGGVYHQLDGFQRLLLDAMTTQMQRLLKRNNEELYRRIEGLEHQMNPNAGRPYGGNIRVNDGSNRIEGQDRIEGVKLNIQHAFSYNDYSEEQKVKLAAATFSDYALKNQREMKREEGREIDTWTEMRRVMRKRYVPTSYSRTMRQKLQRLSQGSLIVEDKEMEMALVRANIEEDTKAVHDGFTNKISFQHHDQKIIHKPLSLREVCDDQIRRREKRKQERDNSEASQRNRKRKSDTLERWSDTQERESDNSNQLTIYEFKDVFPKEIPLGLPPSRSIEHQVDLLPEASFPNRPTYNSKPQETQHKDAQAKVEYVKRLYDQVKVQIAKKNESYTKQANKKRKEVVLEPGDDLGPLRENEGMMRILKLAKYRLKAQVKKDEGPSGEGQSPRVEKDEDPEAETLSRLLISFSLGSLLNQSQTYQGNPCGVYPDLSSFNGSGVIQISIACIKRSAPSQDHIS